MSHPSPCSSLVSLSTTTDETLTPTASTTDLISSSAASPKAQSSSSNAPTATPRAPPAPAKDYESAFAALSSSYGWGGHVPTKAKITKTSKDSKKDKKEKSKKDRSGATPVASSLNTNTSTDGQGKTQGERCRRPPAEQLFFVAASPPPIARTAETGRETVRPHRIATVRTLG
ncbi:hypothetical protein C8Q76DRAFT_698276 [Earliella scabrosa]|nr:hypothetical protein C8Q76DRAFT_698276 [Earliella scabrosa]